jgi:hypothetical protein
MLASSVADPDPHYFRKLYPDPHQSGKLYPDPHQSGKLDPDLHQNKKQDPDLHQSEKAGSIRGPFWSMGVSKSGKKLVVGSGSESSEN